MIKRALLFWMTVFFCSCGTLKNAQMNENRSGSKEPTMKYFIVYKDGKTVELKEFKTTEPIPFGKGKIILDDGSKISVSDLKSFQNDVGFCTRSSTGVFVDRIKKGLINVYMSREVVGSDGGKTQFAKVAWAQKGDSSEIVKLKLSVLKKLVDDYQPALEMANNIKSGLNYKAMDEVIDTYNTQKPSN